MKYLSLVYIALISALITPTSIFCYGLMRKDLNSESKISLICRKSTDFGFCVFILQSDPRSAGASVEGLAHIAVEKLGDHAKDTLTYVQGLRKSCSGKEIKVAETCSHLYDVAANKDVPAAIKSLNGKAYDLAKKAAAATMKDEQNCQQGIDKNPSLKWKMLSLRNSYTHDLSQLSTDLIQLIGK